ncbi:MAG: flagellar motor protein MotB [Rhodospirillaceae bacterium]|nr:flagellar motor protein MotB [Rhodospirillaceae bacterium]
MSVAALVPRRPSRLRVASADAAQRAWLLTFADLVLLLLTFFVLVFSMSEPVRQRYEPLVQSYLEAFAPAVDQAEAPGKPLSFAVEPPPVRDGVPYLQAVLQAAFAGSDHLRALQFRATARYLVIEIDAARLFAPDSEQVMDAAGPMMFDLAGVLGNLVNPVAVVGPVPRGFDDRAGSAWSMGLARADAVAAALAGAGYGNDLTVLASGRDPAAGSDTIQILVFAEGARP